jgi:hypothetical protein
LLWFLWFHTTAAITPAIANSAINTPVRPCPSAARSLPGDGRSDSVGHGGSSTKALLADQRRYIEAFVAALDANVDAIAAGDHDPVLAAMKEVVPADDLLFLLDLSIDPIHSARHSGGAVARP